ncbi:phage integrase SAM-like domain-containing protein [Rahnella aceris]|uniref:phage integrase SAM-like domain-containing protein n=1 Tax=Rahnella sp. (strain Y9602) TaxID=2703885 RepID=UPI000F274FAC|nr:hypothetical protein BJ925_0520 [Rahnella aquatilis]
MIKRKSKEYQKVKYVFQRPNGLLVFCKYHRGSTIQVTLGTRDIFTAALLTRNLLSVYLHHQHEEFSIIRTRLYECRNQLQRAQLVSYTSPLAMPVPVVPAGSVTPNKTRTQKTKKLTLSELLKDYLRSMESEWRGKTLIANAAKCRYFITFIGDRLVTEITKADISEFKQHLVDKGLSPNSCNDYFIKASGMFTFACKQREYISKSPFEGMRFKRVVNLKTRRGITQDEHQQAIKGFAERSQNWWLLQLLYFTGCRISELTQLTKQDYREIEGIWCISINDEGSKTLKNSASRRNIPIHSALLAIGIIEDKPTFVYTPDRASQLVSSIYAGLDVTAHSYRYGMSDRLRKVDVTDYVRFAILGHAHSSTTDRIYRSDDALRRLSDVINIVD